MEKEQPSCLRAVNMSWFPPLQMVLSQYHSKAGGGGGEQQAWLVVTGDNLLAGKAGTGPSEV